MNISSSLSLNRALYLSDIETHSCLHRLTAPEFLPNLPIHRNQMLLRVLECIQKTVKTGFSSATESSCRSVAGHLDLHY